MRFEECDRWDCGHITWGCWGGGEELFCEFCENNAHDGYNCPSYVPFIKTLPSFPQQYLCCEDCGGPPETFQCQPMNYYESNPCYDSSYFGSDQIEPSQYAVNPSLNIQNKLSNHELFINELIQQKLNENAQLFLAIAITLDLPTVEPEDSLRMGDEHPDTIPETESDEFIKSSVENLIPNPSESEDECDDNKSFSDENISKEIYSNPLFDEEIISIKIDLHYFNVESDLIKSLLNHDSLIISSSSKIDSLLDEFAGELILLKSIPPGIDETDCDPEEEIRLIKKLLYDNSSPRPPKEFISENSDAEIESFYPSHIPVEDSDSLMEEIDLTLTPDDSMTLSIKNDDYDSKGDMLILEELLSNDSLSPPENESFHFDIPSSLRPPAKPPDDDEIDPNSEILTVKVVGDISEYDNESFSDKDIPKEIYSNPLFDEEIISIKIDPHHFNVESDLIESLLNQDSSIISSFKIDSLLDEFVGELILLKSIPLRIDETDCDPEEEIRLIDKLLYDNSSPRSLEEFIFENSDAEIESFSPSPIPVEDSDSLREEIDLSLTPDDSIPL
nr:hypothetical protein [Tanacetum cinerariifolium]